MASFFPIGGGGGGGGGVDGGGRSGANNQQEQNNNNNNNNNEISPESWFLYSRNNNNNSHGQVDLHNSPFKGFDLGYGKPAHHHIHHHQLQGSGRRSGIDMVSDQSRSAATFLMMTSGGASSSSGGGISCQDCGNQAKKDCMYLRCRTCCKSRGFHCQTHVKSTWVPASKRRERLQRLVGGLQHPPPQQQDQNYQTLQLHRSDRDDNLLPKRLKDSHNIIVANLDASSGLEAITNFPAEVTSVAVFRCVRVSSVDNANNQHAYQTSVKIGGHLFKGILYDQGLDSSHDHEHQQLNFMNANSSSVPAAAGAAAPANSRGGATPSSQLTGFLDPCLYNSAASLNTFMAAGTQFFPPPRT